jgi:hypothetical protein
MLEGARFVRGHSAPVFSLMTSKVIGACPLWDAFVQAQSRYFHNYHAAMQCKGRRASTVLESPWPAIQLVINRIARIWNSQCYCISTPHRARQLGQDNLIVRWYISSKVSSLFFSRSPSQCLHYYFGFFCFLTQMAFKSRLNSDASLTDLENGTEAPYQMSPSSPIPIVVEAQPPRSEFTQVLFRTQCIVSNPQAVCQHVWLCSVHRL